MTNRDWLNSLPNPAFATAVMKLVQEISKGYSNSYLGIMDWLMAEHDPPRSTADVADTRVGKWKKQLCVSTTHGVSWWVYQCPFCNAVFDEKAEEYMICPRCGERVYSDI